MTGGGTDRAAAVNNGAVLRCIIEKGATVIDCVRWQNGFWRLCLLSAEERSRKRRLQEKEVTGASPLSCSTHRHRQHLGHFLRSGKASDLFGVDVLSFGHLSEFLSEFLSELLSEFLFDLLFDLLSEIRPIDVFRPFKHQAFRRASSVRAYRSRGSSSSRGIKILPWDQ
jgi:hypothetical protein